MIISKRCENCNTVVKTPAFYNGKLVCINCALYAKAFKMLPQKDYINKMRSIELWKE